MPMRTESLTHEEILLACRAALGLGEGWQCRLEVVPGWSGDNGRVTEDRVRFVADLAQGPSDDDLRRLVEGAR